ncbi:hypothetical protein PWT90_06541 [Aphanocladium album]|nr:hypothetical protein PWT90_06541 [Aphanocladium album]
MTSYPQPNPPLPIRPVTTTTRVALLRHYSFAQPIFFAIPSVAAFHSFPLTFPTKLSKSLIKKDSHRRLDHQLCYAVPTQTSYSASTPLRLSLQGAEPPPAHPPTTPELAPAQPRRAIKLRLRDFFFGPLTYGVIYRRWTNQPESSISTPSFSPNRQTATPLNSQKLLIIRHFYRPLPQTAKPRKHPDSNRSEAVRDALQSPRRSPSVIILSPRALALSYIDIRQYLDPIQHPIYSIQETKPHRLHGSLRGRRDGAFTSPIRLHADHHLHLRLILLHNHIRNHDANNTQTAPMEHEKPRHASRRRRRERRMRRRLDIPFNSLH